MSEEKKLSTESYKGTRDFYPEDMHVQNYIFSTMRKVVESFGFVEYGASILEETDLYRAKSGSEIVNEQTYSFTDRGGRDVTIRPEMTPTVARMVAKKRGELAFPLRWYSIPNLFRYERPQRGRLREHWQLNCDIFGLDSIYADVEIVTVAYRIMKAFGAKDGDFQIRINDRELTEVVSANFFALSEDQSIELRRVVDRKKKVTPELFKASVKDIFGVTDSQQHQADIFLQSLEYNDPETYFGWIAKNAQNPSENPLVHKSFKRASEVLHELSRRGITNAVFDPALVRGFDYYTGTVFEVFDTSPENNRSLFGGGRYDDLVSIFGVEKVSAVGFGMGDVTIRDFLETHGLLPKLSSTTKVYLCMLGVSELASYGLIQNTADELAKALRENGVNVAVDYTGRKVDKQIKTAEKQSIPYIICVGEEEASTKRFKLKNLEKREEVEGEAEELVRILK